MSTTVKTPWFEPLWEVVTRRLLRTHFHSLMLLGAERVRDLDPHAPLILFANHSSWWDGILPFTLNRQVFRRDAYAMMEQRQLERYPFFSRLGAFPIVRERPRQAWRAVQHAASLLGSSGRAVWLFPQGTIRPADVRPLGFEPGIGHLVRAAARVQSVPVAFRLEFMGEQRPDCFIAIGRPVAVPPGTTARSTTALLEDALTDLLDELWNRVRDGHTNAFTPLLAGRPSITSWLDRIRSGGGR